MSDDFDNYGMHSVRKGVTYANAETRGRLRLWKTRLAHNYAIFDSAYRQQKIHDLAIEMVKCPRAGRRRAFDKINNAFGPGATLELVRLDKRGQALAIWSILKPRDAVTYFAPDSTPDDKRASLGQDCVAVNYVLIGTKHLLVAEGLWTLEVPDHALGRAVERSRLLTPETIIRDAHRNVLDLPESVLTNSMFIDDDLGAFIKAGAGCFVGAISLAPDRSIGNDFGLHVRVKTWLDENQMHDDQVVLSEKGKPGRRLGDGWLIPAPLRHIERTGENKFECRVLPEANPPSTGASK